MRSEKGFHGECRDEVIGLHFLDGAALRDRHVGDAAALDADARDPRRSFDLSRALGISLTRLDVLLDVVDPRFHPHVVRGPAEHAIGALAEVEHHTEEPQRDVAHRLGGGVARARRDEGARQSAGQVPVVLAGPVLRFDEVAPSDLLVFVISPLRAARGNLPELVGERGEVLVGQAAVAERSRKSKRGADVLDRERGPGRHGDGGAAGDGEKLVVDGGQAVEDRLSLGRGTLLRRAILTRRGDLPHRGVEVAVESREEPEAVLPRDRTSGDVDAVHVAEPGHVTPGFASRRVALLVDGDVVSTIHELVRNGQAGHAGAEHHNPLVHLLLVVLVRARPLREPFLLPEAFFGGGLRIVESSFFAVSAAFPASVNAMRRPLAA